MTIQEVKNYLSQAYYIDKRVITLQDELTMLESKLERCTASYTSIRGGGSQPTFEYNIERKRSIKQTIAKLCNDKERLILYKKYINFQTFESIADDLDITPRQVYKIYKKSLENLQEFIEVQY